jgi:hypothetical protein
MDDALRITAWLNPSSETDSKYGYISNREWLERERDRINKGHRECTIIKKGDGSQALFYLK